MGTHVTPRRLRGLLAAVGVVAVAPAGCASRKAVRAGIGRAEAKLEQRRTPLTPGGRAENRRVLIKLIAPE